MSEDNTKPAAESIRKRANFVYANVERDLLRVIREGDDGRVTDIPLELAAAAPDLLAACQAFEKSWASSGGVGGSVRQMIRDAVALSQQAKAVQS